MIEVSHLTKRYGDVLAVNDLSFSLEPGKVTGFLGPNGAGKSATMRCIVGLDRPTSGTATIDGLPYRDLPSPLTTVGAQLDGSAFFGGRTPRQELRGIAKTHRIPDARVDEVLELTGLASVANKRTKGFSLGMGQRLGIARALLGDPEILLFDEPVNGLDPDGIRWVRQLMRALAAQGRTVFVSSHLMSEMALTADNLIVIGRGALIAQGPITDFTENASNTEVVVAGPDPDAIVRALAEAGFTGTREAPGPGHPGGVLVVAGTERERIGHALFAAGLEIHALFERHRSLEDVFMQLTSTSSQYVAGTPSGASAAELPQAPAETGGSEAVGAAAPGSAPYGHSGPAALDQPGPAPLGQPGPAAPAQPGNSLDPNGGIQ